MNKQHATSQGYIILSHELTNGDFVEIEGNTARYWDASGVQTYTGKIDNLPKAVIQELLAAGIIKKREE
jgi:hypothetical protein